ncbi:unnamed protein product [Penicillium salamii]|uniref:Protein kinase domain-containing protein n=1 Tax=Penicillium salamii TaxID=1612424 RepID=A0A9W4JYY7_9EURO|nr:unnamed protein product [Penicillium salamii]
MHRGVDLASEAHRPTECTGQSFKALLPLTAVPTDQQPLLRRDSVLSISEHASNRSFAIRYGRCHQIIHYGTNSTTRLHKDKFQNKTQLLAIKVYRHSILDEPSCSSQSTSLHPDHPNILPIFDVLQNERSELCLVTPYCAGGDLGIFLSRNRPIPTKETDCILTQILRALSYLHNHGIAHRDIRLETILLTANGAVKVAGFGDGHIRRIWEESTACKPPSAARERPRSQSYSAPLSLTLPWPLNSLSRHIAAFSYISAKPHKSAFGNLNQPYIPPEGFCHSVRRNSEGNSYSDIDPRPADVWATAMIYMALVTGRLLWRSARPHCEDGRYLEYLEARGDKDGYTPIEALGNRRREVIYAMLHPLSWKRITTATLMQSEWIKGVVVCEAGDKGL